MSDKITALQKAEWERFRAEECAEPEQLKPLRHKLFDLTFTPLDRFISFSERIRCRKESVDAAKITLFTHFEARLTAYLESGSGPIVWRIPLEYDMQCEKRIDRYAEDGPEKDFVTDNNFWPVPGEFRVMCLFTRVWRQGAAPVSSAPVRHEFD